VVDPHKKSSKSQGWRKQRTNCFDGEVTSVTFLPKGNSIAIRYEHQQTIIIKNLGSNQDTFSAKEDIIGFLMVSIWLVESLKKSEMVS